jgi:hypothetical protein
MAEDLVEYVVDMGSDNEDQIMASPAHSSRTLVQSPAPEEEHQKPFDDEHTPRVECEAVVTTLNQITDVPVPEPAASFNNSVWILVKDIRFPSGNFNWNNGLQGPLCIYLGIPKAFDSGFVSEFLFCNNVFSIRIVNRIAFELIISSTLLFKVLSKG